jgi:hypothetical protein
MQTTYVGQTKLIAFDGRLFKFCYAAADHVVQAEWAKGVLSAPAVTYPNGRNSHEVANEVLEKAEDGLLDYWRLTA